MKIIISCSLLLFLFLLNTSYAYHFDKTNVKSRLDIFYTDSADTLQSLDVFWNDKSENSNVIFFVHGGGWLSGDKKMYREMALKMAEKGLAVILVNYRLSPGVKFPDHINDVATALFWVSKNVNSYNADPHKIFLMGHSAGAHIISLILLDHNYLKEHRINPDDIAGLISISGVFEIKTQNGGATKRYLEMVFGNEEIWKKASCSTYIDNFKTHLPQLFITWVEGEQDLAKNESANLIKMLDNSDVEYKTFIFKGSDHNVFLTDLQNFQSTFSKEFMEFVRTSKE